MLKKINMITIPILFVVIWIVMNDSLNPVGIVVAVIVTAFSIYLSSYLLNFSYVKAFTLPLLSFMKYTAFLAGQVFMSGISATYMILTGDIKPGFVKCKIDKRIKNPHLQNIVASSITLTPGTITVDKDEENLIVLSLHCDEKNPNAAFEPLLIEIEKKISKEE